MREAMYLISKRLIDLIAASILLTLTTPLLGLTCVLIYVFMGRPIIFKQVRPGLNCKNFTLYKFRTMNTKRDPDGNLLADTVRLTKLGQFIRSSSIDELVQLLNVIKGDMSLIGPRPLLVEYLAFYSPRQMKRHKVKPGISGWAQVNGRNDISWTQKFELDLWYVENRSLLLDLKIALITVYKIVRRSDINKTGMVTTEPFNGKN